MIPYEWLGQVQRDEMLESINDVLIAYPRLLDLLDKRDVRIAALEGALREIADGKVPWAAVRKRIGDRSAVDFIEFARRALGDEA